MPAKNLFTAHQLEELLGSKYFYRQSIYRLMEDSKISSYLVNDSFYFCREEVVLAVLNRLAYKIKNRFPWLPSHTLRIHLGESPDKTISVYGFADNSAVKADTETETEEDLLSKVEQKGREVIKMPDIPVGSNQPHDVPPPPPPHHPPHHGHDRPPHEEVLEALRRIEERLIRIEEKLGWK